MWLTLRERAASSAGRAAWWAAVIQSAGTLFFNVTTFRAMDTALSNPHYDRLVWRPDALGSICFLVSGAIAYRAAARRGWLPVRGGPGWWEPAVNLLGCVFFGISAVAGYVVPSEGSMLDLAAANWTTAAGAACFLACALATFRSGRTSKAGGPAARSSPAPDGRARPARPRTRRTGARTPASTPARPAAGVRGPSPQPGPSSSLPGSSSSGPGGRCASRRSSARAPAPAISASTTMPIVAGRGGSASAARWMRDRELGDGHGATVPRAAARAGHPFRAIRARGGRPSVGLMAEILESWNDGAAKRAIVAFVERAVAEVPAEERVATFDNDGTLWCEKPMPIQADFILRRLYAMAEADPALRDRQPWKAAHERDYAWLGRSWTSTTRATTRTSGRSPRGILAAFAGISVDDFEAESDAFLRASSHPTLGRGYLECAYAPMVELLAYLEANGFSNYIASGGGRDFMRPISQELYGIPRERVIGSTAALEYVARRERRHDHAQAGGRLPRRRAAEADPDLEPHRPPAAARLRATPTATSRCSSSRATQDKPFLPLLVLHDDAEREFDYTSGAERALARAAPTAGRS